ncbi:MAG: hypothetical protein E7673_00195 [Ruminococcaceae bacterium]|nr:hypothetical protein [Oscillospiraceae bacterium]
MKNENKSTISKIRKIGIIVCAIGIISIIVSSLFYGNKKDIPELDFENFSLENVTEEEKLKIPSSYRGSSLHISSSGGRSGISSTYYNDCDRDNMNFSCKKMTGITTVNATKAKDCIVEWVIKFDVSEGNAKIIIVMDEKEIIKEFDPGEDIFFSYEVTDKHNFYVKVLCEKARVEIDVERTIKPIAKK